jgi:glutamate synthase domain-containing protein 2
MRRNWYIGLAVVLLFMAMFFVIWHSLIWFLAVLIPLGVIWFYDVTQKKHAILRNFPVLGHIRYVLEFFRPEIHQYFIADDLSEKPFDRETRTVIYERAKGIEDTVPFGTERDIRAIGYEWALHSMAPKHVSEVDPRVTVGSSQCTKPYSASCLNISAMSYGALSPNAIMAMNKGAKIGNFAHNTGEGGLSDYHLAGGGDLIWQLGTSYFGCRKPDGKFDDEEFAKEIKAHGDVIKMIEIKLSQGAKPSHGGILPAAKLNQEIARIRKVPLGKDVLSPPAHPEFDSPEGLLKFIQRVRVLAEGRPVGFKLCIGRRSEFLGICKAMLSTGILPDFITVDGAEGGTGAAPMEFVNHVGTPLDEALNFVHNCLVGVGLRHEIRVIASGKVATGFDMVTKMALGADLCNSARAMMMATGCIQSLQCNKNTCPTGVATQDKRLMKGLVIDDKKIRVAQYHQNTIHSFCELIGAMGQTSPSKINPFHIFRRLSADQSKSLAEIYEYLEPGALLGKDIPAAMKKHWDLADAKRF